METISIIDTQPGTLWTPSVGPETEALLESLKIPVEGKRTLLQEALRILSRCSPPECKGDNQTGLAVGYVQSGKTMSFTTLTSLARDNGFRMVIIIAGTAIPLYNQSVKRLVRDLRLEDRDDRAWQLFHNPQVDAPTIKAMADALVEWEENLPLHELKTLLVVVMKHHLHLQNLAALLGELDLRRAPVLVIDDEADQASLNAGVNSGEETTTYSRIISLRHALPCHTFVQYTATAQAPLLINIIDQLSPRFAEVLTPGDDYVGGAHFFGDFAHCVREIPPSDIIPQGQVPQEPPASLLEALRYFFLGVAAGIINDGSKGNRSMMVHPSQRVDSHRIFFDWIASTQQAWKLILQQPESDPDRQELLNAFHIAFQDLQVTAPDIPPFDQIVARLPHAITRTVLNIVNAVRGRTPPVDWKGAYPHILVGGQAMDRGFTVEGLTVTYMPRSIGVGNADTIQQRARFFGYKKKYLGYCRVYLEAAARDAYRRYVTHEEDIRERLIEHASTGQPLTHWKRMFFLTSSLKPTRDTVLDLDYMRLAFRSKWFVIKAPHDNSDAAIENWDIVQKFISERSLKPDDGHPERTAIQRHLHARLPLEEVLADLLTPFRVTRFSDSQQFTGLRIQLLRLLETYPDMTCDVYQMSGGVTRERAINDRDEIDNVFQGAHPDKTGRIYPGDQKIFGNGVTVQMHILDLHRNGQYVARQIPTLAVRMPAEGGEDFYVQLQ